MIKEVEKTCKEEGCQKTRKARGWCGTHYDRFWRSSDFVKRTRRACIVCGKVAKENAKGLCRTHRGFPVAGHTPEWWVMLLEIQGGICGNPGCENEIIMGDGKGTGQYARDHDHDTNEPRSVMCGACNTALGVMKEDPIRIAGLLRYAEQCQNVKKTAGRPWMNY